MYSANPKPRKAYLTKLGRFKGVVRGEMDGEEEDPALVGTLRRPHDRGLPVEQILRHWS